MKRFIAGIVLIALFAVTAHAQTNASGSQQPQAAGGARAGNMQKNLGLSDEQMSEIREIRKNGGSREDMRAVLTTEQRAMMDARRAEMKAQRSQADSANGQHVNSSRGAAETTDNSKD